MSETPTSSVAPVRASEPATPPPKGALGVVFFTLFLDLLGFGIIIPIQPFFAESFGAAPSVVTLLSASYSLMQLLFAPLWGRLSDRFGRRPIVLTSIAIGAVGFLFFGFANALWMLFAARMIAGFGNANIGTMQAIVADVTSGADRAKGMGMMGAAFGLGFIFGPAIGGVVGSVWGPTAPAFVAATLGLVNLALAYWRLPETRRPGAPSHTRRGILDIRALADAAKFKNVPQLFAIYFVFTTGFALMETALALFLEHEFVDKAILGTTSGHEQATKLTTIMLLTVGVTAAVVQGGLIGRLKNAFGEKRLMVAGTLLVALGFVMVVQSPLLGFWFVLVSAVVISSGSGITTPSMSSLLSQSVPDERQGELLGLGQSMSAMGRIVGPAMSGLLFEMAHGAPLYVGAVIVGAGTLLALTLHRTGDTA